MSWGDTEITPKGNKLRYEALEDECRVSSVQLILKTIIENS